MQWTKGSNANGDTDYSNEKTWKPEGADTIQGTLVSKKTVNGQDGQPVTVLKLENAEGVWNVWCSRKALKELVAEYDEQLILGRLIGIKTEGPKKVEGTSRTFYPYELGWAEAEDMDQTPTPASLPAVEVAEIF